MLAAISPSMEARNGGREGDRTPNRAAAEGVRGLKHQVAEVRSFRAMLAGYSTDRQPPTAPARR